MWGNQSKEGFIKGRGWKTASFLTVDELRMNLV